VAARGIDVTNVERVINVELPESPALLTHRIGRTGRMGRPGQAITLIGPEDGPKWRQLEKGLTARIARLPWPGAEAAVAGGFEITEPAPQPAGGNRRTGRGGGQERSASQASSRPAHGGRPSAHLG
jgi:superfamily II DNA/RNA helicase